MGNITCISFKKNISDDAFTAALKEVCEKRFNGLVEVSLTYFEGELCSWVIGPSKSLEIKDRWRYEWEVYRKGKRKFGGKHPHSDWGSWMMYRLQNEMAFCYNGRISDEGVDDGTWAGIENKYPKFADYFKKMNRWMYENSKVNYDIIFENTPKVLREM